MDTLTVGSAKESCVAAESRSGAGTADTDADRPGLLTRRRETVRAILAGSPIDPATAELCLGYRLDDHHLGFIIRLDDGLGSTADLERTARRVAEQLEARDRFTLPSGDRTLWVWVRTNRRATVAVSAIAARSKVRIAFGLPATGMAGFRRTHLESHAAQRVLRRSTRPSRLVLYDSVELEHLISQDESALCAFIERELAGVLGPEASAVRLRETLACYLDSMCSVEATARELGVHRNTVRYRIERLEQLLGHPVDSRRLHLEVALRCAGTLGLA